MARYHQVTCLLLVAVAGCLSQTVNIQQQDVDKLLQVIDDLEGGIQALVRQQVLDRLYIEETARADQSSGVKKIRQRKYGVKTFRTESHSGHSVSSIHNHANNKYTIGMGEVIAVLNGVEFRTRHNDFPLIQPSKSSSDFHAFDYIDLPEVPEEVLQHTNVEDQVEAMRKYFKAFWEQDFSVTDYRPYFKPILCYLEGKWTHQTDEIRESFESDRHFIDAKTWYDLENINIFEGVTGTKDSGENKCYLPSKVIGLENGTYPKMAQWDYRIMCHPLSKDLPLNRLNVIDDLDARMRSKLTLDDFQTTRAARFQLSPKRFGKFRDIIANPGLLDELMEEIPGLNNYGASLTDTSYGVDKIDSSKKKNLNTAYYHRMYFASGDDAMGDSKRTRGFNDQNFFGAMNTQKEVVSTCMEDCTARSGYSDCTTYCQKWSYAIPLEIIYLTPLGKWNPYNFEYFDNNKDATSGGKNGNSESSALNGISRKNFYQTPAEFFTGYDNETDSADTSGSGVWVKDRAGVAHLMRASGHYITIPEIEGVGHVRQRWPIVPISSEGNHIQKELDALKEIVLSPSTFKHMFYEDLGGPSTEDSAVQFLYSMPDATAEFGSHSHFVGITKRKIDLMKEGRTVAAMSELAHGHEHDLRLQGFLAADGSFHIKVYKCDGMMNICADGHTGMLVDA